MATRDSRETTERLLRAEMQRIADEEDGEDDIAEPVDAGSRLEGKKERV
jgi:hypothetical protein